MTGAIHGVSSRGWYYIPVRLRSIPSTPTAAEDGQGELFVEADVPGPSEDPNLSDAAKAYLAGIGVPDAEWPDSAETVWMHVLAIGYAPAYIHEHAADHREDWLRVPMPNTPETLARSAELGRQVAALLDTESPALSVTTGSIRPELRPIGVTIRADGRQLQVPGDLEVRARWGYSSTGGIVMGGAGKLIRREYDQSELDAIEAGVGSLGLTVSQALDLLGNATCDVYLNDLAYWRNVPERVWEFRVGGYQVIKKWLSYRERPLLGRGLEIDEAYYVQGMARRIAATLLLGPRLDANYAAVRAATYPWPKSAPRPLAEANLLAGTSAADG